MKPEFKKHQLSGLEQTRKRNFIRFKSVFNTLSIMIESSCQIYNPVNFGSIHQGKVEILSAERELQKKAGLMAEKAHNELKETARMAEVWFNVLSSLCPTPT